MSARGWKTFRGRPVTSLTRDELLELVEYLSDALDKETRQRRDLFTKGDER